MRRKKNKEKQKEAKKKAADRIKHYKELKEKPKRVKTEKVPETGSNTVCQEYIEKSVINGDDDWHRRFYYYEKKPPTGKKFSV